jgi:phosphoribosylanthranilate isomerase
MSGPRRNGDLVDPGGGSRRIDGGGGVELRGPDAGLARIFVKICGLTTADAVTAAVEAGVDAAGFVFSESPRRVSIEQAAVLAALLPRHVLKVAVLRRTTREELATLCERFAPDVIQADAECLRGVTLPCGVRALPVVREGESIEDGSGWMLYESRESGAGRPADWSAAAAVAQRRAIILAGGLDAPNVEEALRRVHPWGVDVSSGVEETRGVKSARKIREFVEAVRAAERKRENA